MIEKGRWRKMKKRDAAAVETLLCKKERWCLNACSRYRNLDLLAGSVWTLRNRAAGTDALVVYAKQSLLPVFGGQREIPPPRFLRRFFRPPLPVHSLQGIKCDAALLEQSMEKIGFYAAEHIEYDIMCIDCMASLRSPAGIANLVIRRPEFTDIDALAVLQAAYEREEVVPKGSSFSAAASRMNIERILAHEQIMVAEFGGVLAGKINTSAAGFTRFQIGGVYVHPAYRGQGIARGMAAEFISSLLAQQKGVSLFVKKTNAAARRLYLGLGFVSSEEYRISYY
jgi:predicted GNAT family acetyltransferase